MAAPKRNARSRALRPETAEQIRNSIRADQLKEKLEDHVLKGTDLSQTQVRAALGLLAIRIPAQSQVDTTLKDETKRVVSGEAMDDAEWERRYGNSLAATSGPSESTH